MRLIAVAARSFHEVLRMRALYLVAASCVVLIILAPMTPSFEVGVRVPLFLNLAFSLSYIASLCLVVGLGVTALPRELSSRTAMNALSKPISRTAFILGKYLGVMAAVAGTLALFTVLTFTIGSVQFDSAVPAVFAVAWTQMLQLSLLGALAFLLSVRLDPLVNVSVLALLYLILETGPTSLAGSGTALLRYAANILPDLARFDIADAVAHGVPVTASATLLLTLYGIVWTAFFLLAACLVFGRLEMD